jgi:hypothetical protein
VSAALLALLVANAPVGGADAPNGGAVIVKVDRDGLRYTGDCEAWFFAERDFATTDTPALKHTDLKTPAQLPRGAYHVQVRCPSTEGVLAQTFLLKLNKKKQTLRAKLRPGFAFVRVRREKAEEAADLVFYDRYGREVQRGRDKVVHPLPPGTHAVVATIRKTADARATGQKQRRAIRTVKVRSGKKSTLRLDVSDGSIAVKILHNGKPAAGSGALYLPGTRREVARVASGEAASAPPGFYDLATRLDDSHDFSERRKRKIQIRPGKTTRATLKHSTGKLKVKLVRGGLPLVAGEDANIELFLGAAPDSFNTLALGETAILAPGKYKVRATLSGRKDAIGSVADEKMVTIAARKTRAITLDLSSSPVTVLASVGGEPKRLLVEISRGGRTVVRRKSGRDGKLKAPLSPGRYEVRATLEATGPRGVLEVKKRLKVARGEKAQVGLDLDLGRAVVQVFERGIAIPAEVSFRREDAAEPLLRAAGGEEVHLPPGRYVLTVGRGSFERTFSPIAVAAGKVVERQLELIDEEGRSPAEQAEAKRKKLRLKGE